MLALTRFILAKVDIVLGTGITCSLGSLVTVHVIAKEMTTIKVNSEERRGLPMTFRITEPPKERWHQALIGQKQGGIRLIKFRNDEGTTVEKSSLVKLLNVKAEEFLRHQ